MQNLMDLSLDSPVLVQNEFGHVDLKFECQTSESQSTIDVK